MTAFPLLESAGLWWCNSHQREATHIRKDGTRCCDPKLGGILLSCQVVFAPMVIGRRPARDKAQERRGKWTRDARHNKANAAKSGRGRRKYVVYPK